MSEKPKYTVEQWLQDTLAAWKENIKKQRIGKSGDLARSLASHVTRAANGNLEKVSFFYNYYGLFVDMGVSRGIKSGEQAAAQKTAKILGTKGRKIKKWYSRTMIAQTGSLSRLMQQTYGNKAIEAIVREIPKNVNI